MRQQRGVTLVELMVALAIFVVAIGAMLPSAADWLRSLSVRNTTEAMRNGIEQARMEALRRNTSVTFWLVNEPAGKGLTDACVLSANGTAWVVSLDNPEGKCSAAPPVPPLNDAPRLVDKWASSESAGTVTVQGADADAAAAASVTFSSLGQLQGEAPLRVIDVSHSTPGVRALRIMLDPGGSVRSCDPLATGTDPRKC